MSIANGSMGSGSSVCMGSGSSVCMGSGSSVCIGSRSSVCMGGGLKGHKHLAQGIALGKKPASNIALKGQKPYNAIPAFALTGRYHSTLAKTQGDALGYGHIGLSGRRHIEDNAINDGIAMGYGHIGLTGRSHIEDNAINDGISLGYGNIGLSGRKVDNTDI